MLSPGQGLQVTAIATRPGASSLPCLASLQNPSSAASPILIMALAEIKTTLDSCPLPGKRKQEEILFYAFSSSFFLLSFYSPFLPCPSPRPSLLLYGLLFC